MKVISYITPEMDQMSDEQKLSCTDYESRLNQRGYYVREKRILTATIVLYILENSDDTKLCSGWAYFPKTNIDEFVSSIRSESDITKDAFAEICTDRVLKDHNWFNHDVECAIGLRKKTAVA